MEASEPKAVLAVLQSLFATMHEIVYAHGGIVDKHLGDGLMAVFGLSGEELRNRLFDEGAQAVGRCHRQCP